MKFRQDEPGDGFPADFLRRGLSFRPVIQPPAVGGYAVPGGLAGEGLAQGAVLAETRSRVMVVTFTTGTSYLPSRSCRSMRFTSPSRRLRRGRRP